MNQFKKGDRVKRVASSHNGMVVGDTAIVRYQEGDSYLYLEGYEFSHDPVNFELVKDEKEIISKWLKENKWWIKCESKQEFNLIASWLKENSTFDCRLSDLPRACKLLTNYTSVEIKDYIMWDTNDNYLKENEIKLEFETIIKNVQLPEITPKKTEAQLKLEELQKIVEDAQQKIAELKEEIK